MRLFVLVFFWIGIGTLFMRLIHMTFSEWPHQETQTLGNEAAKAIESIAWLAWAGILLWAL